jgi:hypothetical protein
MRGTLEDKLIELVLSKGGWRDLNHGEDVELVSRIGFNIHIL